MKSGRTYAPSFKPFSASSESTPIPDGDADDLEALEALDPLDHEAAADAVVDAADAAAEAAAADAAAAAQALDDEELELTDDDEMEEVPPVEAAAPPQAPVVAHPVGALPVGGEGLSGPLVLPPAPPEEPPAPSVLDAALAEVAAADWAQRAADLRAELDGSGGPEPDRARVALLAYELGELSERRLRDEAGAVKSFGRALQSDPSLRPNLWAIRRVFYRRGLWPNLLKLIDAEVRFARNDRERADLLVEKAHIFEDRLGDAAQARDTLERAVALDGTHVGALLGRERQALLQRDNEALLRVWRLLAEASTAPARKAGYLIDRARLMAALALAGPPDAMTSSLQEALDVIAEAGALAGAPGVDPELVALERERLAEMSGEPEDMLAAGDVRVALLARDPRRSREIVSLRRRQARVARSRGDRAEALRYLSEAAALLPDEPLLCYDLADLGEEAGADDATAAALERLDTLLGSAGPALALRRAEALERAGHDGEASGVREALRAATPGYLPLVARDERIALRAGDRARVAAARLEEAQAAGAGQAFGPDAATTAQPAWAAAAATSAGDLLALDLGRAEDARAAYETALGAVPGYPYAIEGLVALHVSGGRPDEAARLLEREVATATGVRADEMLERLAAIYETAGLIADAQRTLERLLARRPDDDLARHRLERLHAAAGHHAERVTLLAELAERAADPVRKAAILFETGRIREELLDDLGGALETYRVALALDPHDRVVRGALLAALRRAGRFDELAAELRVEATVAEGQGGQRALRGAAAILARRLGRAEDAAAVYRELLDQSTGDVSGDAAVVRGLASALADSPDEAAPVLEREIALLGDGPAAAQTLIRLGDLFETLSRDEDAASAYRRAAETDEGVAAHAAWALVEIASRRGDRQALSEALTAVASGTRDDRIRGDLHEELAWLSADDVEGATGRFAAVAEQAPDRRGAQLGKALLAARRNDAQELAAALTAQAEQTTDARVAGSLLLRAAALEDAIAAASAGAGASSERAAELSARAQALLPDDPGALVAAVERANGDGAELLARRAALCGQPETAAELHLARAELLERQGRLADAGRALTDVLAAAPGHLGALYALRRVARRGGDRETLARASFQLGLGLTEPSLAAGHLADAAVLLDGELHRPEQAARVWRRVFDLAPDHPTAFLRSHELLRAGDDVGGLLDLLGRKIESLGPSAEVAPHRLERAALRRRVGQNDEAAEDLEHVLALDPDRLEALMALADVRLAQGNAAAGAALLAQYNEAVSDPEQRAEGELRLAHLYEELGDRAGAISSYEIVLTARSDDMPAREKLIELLLAEESFPRAAEEIERQAEHRGDRAARARDELRAARLHRDRTGDLPRARRAYERTLAADPLNVEALRELAGLLHGDGPQRSAALERAAAEVRPLIGVTDAQPLHLLVVVAGLAGDDVLAFSATGALDALGANTEDERRRYLTERQRAVAQPLRPRRGLSDDEWRTRVEHPALRGPLGEAWLCVAESAARAGGDTDPAQLGFAKGDKIATKALARTAPAVEAALRVAGLSEAEVWVTASRSNFARAVALETPLLLLSADVARADTLEARTLLGRTLGGARLRAGALEDASVEDLALHLLAGIKAAGGDAPRAPALTPFVPMVAGRIDERSRAMGRVLARKEKKALGALLDKGLGGDLAGWLTAVRATTRRLGLLLGGDLPLALAGERARGGGSPLSKDLISLAVSEGFLYLRKDLGLA